MEAAARHQSFKRAAEEIGVTASAISHRVRTLEAELGIRLFDRTGSGVELTDAGTRLAKSISRAIDGMSSTWTDLLHEARGRPIRVSCAPMFASQFLFPNIAKFTQQKPDLNLEIVSTNNVADIADDEADIGVRLSPRPPSPLWCERLSNVSFVPVVARNKSNELTSVRRINGPLLCLSYQPDMWTKFQKASDVELAKEAKLLHFDSLEATVAAAQGGAGVALLPDWIANHSEYADGLVALQHAAVVSDLCYWITMRRSEKDSANYRAVRKWIKKSVSVNALGE